MFNAKIKKMQVLDILKLNKGRTPLHESSEKYSKMNENGFQIDGTAGGRTFLNYPMMGLLK